MYKIVCRFRTYDVKRISTIICLRIFICPLLLSIKKETFVIFKGYKIYLTVCGRRVDIKGKVFLLLSYILLICIGIWVCYVYPLPLVYEKQQLVDRYFGFLFIYSEGQTKNNRKRKYTTGK